MRLVHFAIALVLALLGPMSVTAACTVGSPFVLLKPVICP